MKRLHLIITPITEYISYEMYFYLINEKAGEKIKCIDYNNTDYKIGDLDDFIIFDTESIIINCHDNDGKYLKSYYYDKDKDLIKELINKYTELYDKATKYTNYAKFKSELIYKLNDNNLI